VASLGAFVPGYILIVPAAHAFNTRSLGSKTREDLAQFTNSVLTALEAQVGEVTVFEHGSCFDGHTRRSACTEHAHFHLVPGQFNLDPDLPTSEVHNSLRDFLAVGPGDGSPYLMLRNPGQPVRVYPDPGISQYVRRLIAAALGEPDDWDYAVFPHMDNVKATLELPLDLVVPGAS
jgi:diadenosine tetraphosphate (Ap4A) HIT family hydrolase